MSDAKAPVNDLDMAMQMTNPMWGDASISPELKAKLREYYKVTGQEGKTTIVFDDLWGLLNMYTRDLRLSNTNNQEHKFCTYMIDLARDCLAEGYIKPFLTAMTRAVTVLELAQSRGGFLRNRQGTISSETKTIMEQPTKKSFFGGSGSKA